MSKRDFLNPYLKKANNLKLHKSNGNIKYTFMIITIRQGPTQSMISRIIFHFIVTKSKGYISLSWYRKSFWISIIVDINIRWVLPVNMVHTQLVERARIRTHGSKLIMKQIREESSIEMSILIVQWKFLINQFKWRKLL